MTLFDLAVTLAKGFRPMQNQIDYEREFDDVDRRANEDLKEQRWNDFVADLQAMEDGDLREVVLRAAGAYLRSDDAEYLTADLPFVSFSESEGWSGVFSAIARAIHDEEVTRHELEARR